MRKQHFWLGTLLAILLSATAVLSASSRNLQADGLTLLAPSACPSGGCAAGQRLNFALDYSVAPEYSGTNTQVCVYTPDSGWSDYGSGWLSTEGLVTGATYTVGETNSICTNNTPAGYSWLAGAYANLSGAASSDQLEIAFNINNATSTAGDVKLRVFQVDSGGTSWSQTADLTSPTINVAALTSSVFVANNAIACGANTPCFINSGDDEPDGLGTGLRDAVQAVSAGSTIQVLGDTFIKSETVLIDKALTLSGVGNARLTYSGSVCSNAMLSVTSEVNIENLTLDDGSCTSSSRTLIDVDSAQQVAIEHNTLKNGYVGILIRNNSGDVRAAFNVIDSQNSYAVFQETSGSDLLLMANNITENANGIQVICNGSGDADHNFWGEGQSAPSSVLGCQVTNGKELGAAGLTDANTPGISAEQVIVTTTKQYAFDNEIAYSRSGGTNYDLVIVNHGQGAAENVPFYDTLGDSIQPCSNYYDVFLADGATPSSLNLALKYDLNSECTSKIESSAYCASGTMAKFPLWWYDPAFNVTEYWDTTGQSPDGTGAGSATGQTTSCNTNLNEIQVSLTDLSSARPRLSTDLGFTPFVVGLANDGGIDLSQFTVTFDTTENKVRWSTSSESNISGFHVLRSDSENGTYARISPLIESIGDNDIGGIYYFTDDSIQFTRTYYYKLEVVNKQGESVEFYGPVSVITSTATPTSTMTRTPTLTRTPWPTRTSTPYYYRSPTSYYRRATSTPWGGPTQVRTYGPTPTPSRTTSTKPTYDPTSDSSDEGYPADGYPLETQIAGDEGSYPPGENSGGSITTPTPGPNDDQGEDQNDGNDREDDQGESPSPDDPSPTTGQAIQWPFMALGSALGIVLLALASWVLIRLRVS
jgi:hypothetical protein